LDPKLDPKRVSGSPERDRFGRTRRVSGSTDAQVRGIGDQVVIAFGPADRRL